MADKALNLYNGVLATGVLTTYVGLFTTAPTSDDPLTHGGVEWGPARSRVFANSSPSSPRWSLPSDFSTSIRQIINAGSLQWAAITLTTSPSTVVAFGVWDAVSAGNLLTWDSLVVPVLVTDGESRVIGTGDLKIKGD